MLVLSRREREMIVIDGGRIVIDVLEIRHDKVRLGFTAPDDTIIDRQEVHAAKFGEERSRTTFEE